MYKVWKGKYNYLNEDEIVSSSEFEIRAEYDNGSFKGTVFEDEFSKASGELVEIKGFFELDYVSFVKTYPYSWELDQDYNVVLLKDKPGHDVRYFGRLNGETRIWEGEWEVEFDSKFDPINPGFINAKIMFGTWEMKLLD